MKTIKKILKTIKERNTLFDFYWKFIASFLITYLLYLLFSLLNK